MIGCGTEEVVDEESEELSDADLAELPAEAQGEDNSALAGQANYFGCEDPDAGPNQYFDVGTTTYNSGSFTDRCYTWYKNTPKEKARIIEGSCYKGKLRYRYVTCSRLNYKSPGADYQCVNENPAGGWGGQGQEGHCVDMNVEEAITELMCDGVYHKNEKFANADVDFQYQSADKIPSFPPAIKIKDLKTGDTIDRPLTFDGYSEVSFNINSAGKTYNFVNASTAVLNDFDIKYVCNVEPVVEVCEPTETGICVETNGVWRYKMKTINTSCDEAISIFGQWCGYEDSSCMNNSGCCKVQSVSSCASSWDLVNSSKNSCTNVTTSDEIECQTLGAGKVCRDMGNSSQCVNCGTTICEKTVTDSHATKGDLKPLIQYEENCAGMYPDNSWKESDVVAGEGCPEVVVPVNNTGNGIGNISGNASGNGTNNS